MNQKFSCDLEPVPVSLFWESGDVRYPNNKTVLMNICNDEVYFGGIELDAVLVDVGECCIKLTVQFFIFDRYVPDSVKSNTRDAKACVFRRLH